MPAAPVPQQSQSSSNGIGATVVAAKGIHIRLALFPIWSVPLCIYKQENEGRVGGAGNMFYMLH